MSRLTTILRATSFALLAVCASAYAQSTDEEQPDAEDRQFPVVEEEIVVEEATLPQEDDDAMAGPLDQVVPVAEEEEQEAIAADEAQLAQDEAVVDELVDEAAFVAEFTRFRRLMDEGATDEADASAKRIVEMAIRLYGPQSRETSKALNNLALVQYRNGQFEPAIQNFISAVEIIEDLGDRLSIDIVNPLKGLGAAQLGNGRPDLAAQSFTRAAHITEVNEGPHNLEQIEILESLAESQVRIGDMKAAKDVLERIYILNVRHFENDPMGLLPALIRRAHWQHRAGYYIDERTTYRRAIRIIEEVQGKDSPMLIEPLVMLGKSFYFTDMSVEGGVTYTYTNVSTGENYMKRAVRIAENTPDYPWLDLANTKLALGDLYMYKDSIHRATSMYQEVWALLSADEDRLFAREEAFSDPVPVVVTPLPAYAAGMTGTSAAPENVRTGTVRVDYEVSTRGRVSKIRSEASPRVFTDMLNTVHREIRDRRFRPQVVNGEPVDSTPQTFVHAFYYRQSDLDKLLKENPPPPEDSPPESEDDDDTEVADHDPDA